MPGLSDCFRRFLWPPFGLSKGYLEEAGMFIFSYTL